MRRLLAAIPSDQREFLSASAVELLRNSPLWQNANVIAAFWPLPAEPDITPLFFLPGGPVLLLPRIVGGHLVFHEVKSGQDLLPGPFGILQPSASTPARSLESVGLILVPGLAFTRHGARLGRGQGFYDRALSSVPIAKTVGLCFPGQILEHLPTEAHDRPVGWLLDSLVIRRTDPQATSGVDTRGQSTIPDRQKQSVKNC